MYFSPTPCEIDTGKLDQVADDMLEIVGRITGKSGDLESLFTDAALEFSDLIAEEINILPRACLGFYTPQEVFHKQLLEGQSEGVASTN